MHFETAVPSVRIPSWHAVSANAALSQLGSSERGLSTAAAAARLAEYGPNVLADGAPRGRLRILADQLANLPNGLLAGSSVLSALTGDRLDAGAILSAVGLNAAIGYRIESHNADLLESWRRLEAGRVQVVRGGALRSVAAATLVPGDVVLCRAGDQVPADLRVLNAHRLRCDEAALTGESEPQAKDSAPVAKAAPLAQRSCLLFAGTAVVSGHGRAVVVASGARTEMARVRALVEGQPPPATPLQRQLDRLGRAMAGGGLASGALAAAIRMATGAPVAETLRGGVALAVAAIPEGLPMVATAALVRAMQRMRDQGMVVRRLAAAETLGGVRVVCADKTGTLTRNDMQVEVLWLDGRRIDPAGVRARPAALFRHLPSLALAAAVLNSDVDVQQHNGTTAIAGSSTERALVRAAEGAGLRRDALRRDFPRRELRERTADLHYVVSVHDRRRGGGPLAFVKGAPEQVLRLCATDAGGRRLGAAARQRVLARNRRMAAAGLRVLALAWRPGDRDLRRGFRLLGLVGLRDPLRDGAADVVRRAAGAGLRTIILTGDQKSTAASVARLVGLDGEVREGAEVTRLLAAGGPRADAMLDRLAAVARVTPADKLAIVAALRRRGATVAMAGDGINDAPALRAADVGIAVGRDASDLARQAADVVLANEDLRAIVAAVGEGRVVQDNLRRAVRYLLATNLSEVVLSIGAALARRPAPLTPLQLLWINLLSDTLPALALAREPAHGDVLARPPAPSDAPLVDAAGRRLVVRDGLGLAALGAAAYAVGGPPLVFASLGGAELGYALVCRPADEAIGRSFARWLGAAAALHLAALTLPPLRLALGLGAVPRAVELLGFAGGAALPLVLARLVGDDPPIVRHGRSAGPPRRRAAALPPAARRQAARLPDRRRRSGTARLEVRS